ncbi:hypothetical protein L6164_007162 [Bauhinia variegata]|uniref:Uncharacterized protein n=1 Tax=Bauhinia variegata TaxID=167791 RepID=A0ACB9PY60_BAUVA|nr:hypothetical protein L6164_007162 [Bauhinia variegata]
MGRRDSYKLYVTVPTLFRCPISMDVMRSPVSLCTGVTYDRSSIQNWLDSGHDTCPATMQVLPYKDFTPNLTLHRLIDLWLRSGDCSLASPSSSSVPPSPCSVSTDDVRDLIHRIRNDNEEDVAVSLPKVLEFASYSEENRRFLANFAGFYSVVVGIIGRNGSELAFWKPRLKFWI